MMDIAPGQVVRWYSRSGGWRWGEFVRVVHPRRGKSGVKGEIKALVKRGGGEEKVPLAEVRPWR